MKDLGEAKFILGIKIERKGNQLYLSQEEYLTRVLRRFEMLNSKGINTPLQLGIKAPLSKSPISKDKSPNNYPYREAKGCLMYDMLCTGPDLRFPICYLTILKRNIGQP